MTTPCIAPITPPPREAVQVLAAPLVEAPAEPHHRRAFGVPIHETIRTDINTIAVKDPALQRPITEDSAKFVLNGSSGLLFRDNNSLASPFTSGSPTESPSLFKIPFPVNNTTVSSSPLFGESIPHTPATMSLDLVKSLTGTITFAIHPNPSDTEFAQKMFDECLVNDFEDDDNSFLFTPHTGETSFTNSTLTSGLDTPSLDLAQIDSFLSATGTGFGDQDFNLFGEVNALNTENWKPLFNPASGEETFVPSSYASFPTATVTSASPKHFTIPTTIGTPSVTTTTTETLPSPELSPPSTRKSSTPALRRPSALKATRKLSSAPYTPITPAPTTPSTPQPLITRATKRRIPVVNEDPAVVEKRRRNTIAAQRSRARKAEEKAEDKNRIADLEKELAAQRTLTSYWKDRAVELGASSLEDGEN